MLDQSPFVVVPGWGGSGPEHWQTHWQQAFGAARTEVADWFCPDVEIWIAAIETTLARLARRNSRPPVLLAHSLGCIAVAHWAQRHRRSIRAAFLVAPADTERSRSLSQLRGFGPIPDVPLPFSSLVVASDNDTCISVERAEQLAMSWGSELHVIAGAGHINTDSGHGLWDGGLQLLRRLLRRTQLSRSA